MRDGSALNNLWQAITRFSRGQKLAVGIMILVTFVTWLAACALLLSLFS